MRRHVFLWALYGLLTSCQDPEPPEAVAPVAVPPAPAAENACTNRSETGMALFGDLHVHTSFSFDAAANSTGATPADAHRFARGEAIPFFPIGDGGTPLGSTRIDRPLDFLAVTDHGEFLGERALCRTAGSPAYDTDFCREYRSDERRGMSMLGTVITSLTPVRIPEVCGEDGARCREFAASPWKAIQQAANEAYEPCEFTSFVAYEYTGTPGGSNYHRNVIFKGDAVPELPVSYVDAPIDSKLWSALDDVCASADGCEYLTIPHNTNLANGRMAPYMQLSDTVEARSQYAKMRLRREPIMEIFQHKGNSECINGLSAVLGAPDELCNIEAVRRIGQARTITAQAGPTTIVTTECGPGAAASAGMIGAGCVDLTDFHRSALLVGLKEEQETGFNPVRLGAIAATDTHTATPGAALETDWNGAVTGESTPAERLQPGLLTSGIEGNPGGLAGVWAKENTREAIFDAMLRREVFGTSGPRIQVRFFGGWSLDDDLCRNREMMSTAYASAQPMGGDLPSGPSSTSRPKFLAYALKDPAEQDLESLHLVKGWVDADGALHNQVISIAQVVDGAESLCSVYTDESFDASLPAYYYLRVVEPPTPRWHTYDCARISSSARPPVCGDGSFPDTVREMAWTSPIWYGGRNKE